LDSAAAAALSGPFGFNLNADHGISILLPHLPGLKHFTEMFAGRSMVALRDGDPDAAWTNLLAATRVVTAWQVEPTEVSQNTRFNCLRTVYNLTWQALQAGKWSDARLAQLQREWESLDVFKPLPDTIAFLGASYVALLQREDVAYSDENETGLLVFYHDRELEMRRVLQTESWAQIRLLPDITSATFAFPPGTNLPPRLRMLMESRRFSMAYSGGSVGLAGRAAEAEARRRLVITAIALERFHVQHGAYPQSLDALVPDLLKTLLLDFMNGQPMHYSLNGNEYFILYSVGLDGSDDGGKMLALSDDTPSIRQGTQRDPDIVWPYPASAAQANAYVADKAKRMEEALAAAQKRGADHEAEVEAARRAATKELLNNPKYRKTTWTGGESEGGELLYKGQPITQLFRNTNSLSSPPLTQDTFLTLTPVVIGNEPQIIAYQVPIAYDRLTNNPRAHLSLLMDSSPDDNFENETELSGCERATNGDSLLVWNTAFEKPGLHAMQALLTLPTDDVDHELEIKGPALAFLSTNLCQFNADSSLFSDTGANIFARVAESNAIFSIEIKTRAGNHVKTFTGGTTNGVIALEWDLVDDGGVRYTNNSFTSYFHITVPSSGRSQTFQQPQNKIGTRGE
jgi:hypothetical protein